MISDMRYTHLVAEAGTLLAELRRQGATFEDYERSRALLDSADPSTIGRVIHDLQLQIQDLAQANIDAGMSPDLLERLDIIEWQDEI